MNTQYKNIFLSVLAFSNLLCTASAEVTIEFVKGGDLSEAQVVFNRAFKDAYKDVSLDVLKVESLDAFLQAAFEDEPLDLNNPSKKVVCAIAKEAGRTIGFITFEPTENSDEVYVRQLAVDPVVQKKGVGHKLMAAIDETFPKTKRIVLATRKVNTPACNFYKKQGFQECKQVPHGLNPERYVGFEKQR